MSKKTDKMYPLHHHVAKRLQLAREMVGNPSQEMMGAIADTNGSGLSRLENGEYMINIVQLYRLARAYNLPVSWFFEDFDEPPSEVERIRSILQKEPGPRISASQEEKEAGLLAIWRALPDEEHRERLLNLMELLVHGKP